MTTTKKATKETTMTFVNNDGGRKAAGYSGKTGDCATRAAAIATGLPYQTIYDRINTLAATERPRGARSRSGARTGVWPKTLDALLTAEALHMGADHDDWLRLQGALTAGELPSGRLVVRLSRHYAAVIDGVIHDTYDPSRDGTRCVYGYWQKYLSLKETTMTDPNWFFEVDVHRRHTHDVLCRHQIARVGPRRDRGAGRQQGGRRRQAPEGRQGPERRRSPLPQAPSPARRRRMPTPIHDEFGELRDLKTRAAKRAKTKGHTLSRWKLRVNQPAFLNAFCLTCRAIVVITTDPGAHLDPDGRASPEIPLPPLKENDDDQFTDITVTDVTPGVEYATLEDALDAACTISALDGYGATIFQSRTRPAYRIAADAETGSECPLVLPPAQNRVARHLPRDRLRPLTVRTRPGRASL